MDLAFGPTICLIFFLALEIEEDRQSILTIEL